MRSNINKLKEKYNITTDKGLLNYLADKECMPPIPVVDIKVDKIKKVKEIKEDVLTINEDDTKEIFSSIKLDILSSK